MGASEKSGYERYVVKTYRFHSSWNDDYVEDFELETTSLEEAMRVAQEQAAPYKGDEDNYLVCVSAYGNGDWCGYVHADGHRKEEILNWVSL